MDTDWIVSARLFFLCPALAGVANLILRLACTELWHNWKREIHHVWIEFRVFERIELGDMVPMTG